MRVHISVLSLVFTFHDCIDGRRAVPALQELACHAHQAADPPPPPPLPPWLFMYILSAISAASCTADSLLAPDDTRPAEDC